MGNIVLDGFDEFEMQYHLVIKVHRCTRELVLMGNIVVDGFDEFEMQYHLAIKIHRLRL